MYKIVIWTDTEQIGTDHGGTLFIKETQSYKVFKQMRDNSPLGIELLLDCFYLLEGAILNDILHVGSSSTTGFLVNQKFVDLARKFECYNTEFIPAQLTDWISKEIIGDYYLLHCYSDLLPFIDFENEAFLRINLFGKIEEKYSGISHFDILNLTRQYAGHLCFIRPENGYKFLYFDYKEYDMLRIGHFDESIYISEPFKNALMENGITGADFIKSGRFS